MKILIDANNIAHIAFHSMKGLSYKGKRTGVIFGFLNEMFKIAKKFKSNDLIFCWDTSRKNNLRKKIYPEYKANRDKDLTEQEKKEKKIGYKQFGILKNDVIPKLGFNSFVKKGYEADDLIAYIVRSTLVNDPILIVSTDQDLFQLLAFFNVKIYNTRKKKLIDKVKFEKQFNIIPEKWALVKTLAGCSSDNIKGIKGVGEKTAIKYLNNDMKKGKIFEKIESNYKKMVLQNFNLVCLPYINKDFKLELKKTELSRKAFIEVFDKYGFRTFEKEFKQWEEVFNLK